MIPVRLKPKKRSKYGAKKITADGIVFDSALEYRYYQELMIRFRAIEIGLPKIHPKFPITINGKKICVVELDFEYWDLLAVHRRYVDCKGFDTPMSRLKRKLVEAQYGITVEIVTK